MSSCQWPRRYELKLGARTERPKALPLFSATLPFLIAVPLQSCIRHCADSNHSEVHTATITAAGRDGI